MATNIEVPGIGKIDISSLAQEETLEKIVVLLGGKTKQEELRIKALNKRLDEAEKGFGRTNKKVEDFGDSLDDVAKEADKREEKALQNQIHREEQASESTRRFSKEFAKSLGGLASSLIGAFGSLTKGDTSFSALSGVLQGTAEAAGQGAAALGGGMQMAGASVYKSSKVAGGALMGLGAIAQVVGPQMAKYASQFGTFMLAQADMFSKAFADISGTGAFFTNGLSGMISAAGDVGLNLSQFQNVVKTSAADLRAFGGDAATGSQKLGGVIKNFSKESTLQMRRMGISAEEQAEGVAAYMALLQKGGQLRGKSDAQLATQSQQYVESLKIISAITGQEAKALQAKAQDELNNAAVNQKLSEMGGDAAAKFAAQMALLPESLQKAYRQQLLTGGSSTNFLAQQGPIGQLLLSYMKNLKDSSVTAKESAKRDAAERHRLSGAIGEQAGALSSAVVGGEFGQSSDVAGLINDAQQLSNQGRASSANAAANLEAQKNTADTKTSNLIEAGQAMQEASIEAQRLSVAALGQVTGLINEMSTALRDLIATANKAPSLAESLWTKAGSWLQDGLTALFAVQTLKSIVGGVVARTAGGAAAAALPAGAAAAGGGAMAVMAATAVTAVAGVLAAGAGGYAIGSVIEKILPDSAKPDGEKIAKVLAFFGNDEAQASLDINAKFKAMEAAATPPSPRSALVKPPVSAASNQKTEAGAATPNKITATSPTAELKDIMAAQLSMMNEFVRKVDDLINVANEQKQISQGILNNTY